jgi:hypothetical protein
VCGTHFVQAGQFSPLALMASIPVGLVITAILLVNNLRDIATERRAGKRTLAVMIGAWRQPDLPVILSGMIGSRQGWVETPYLPVPTSFDAIANALVSHPDDPDIHLVPGLAQDLPGEAPDVMRGEETQIIGRVGARLRTATSSSCPVPTPNGSWSKKGGSKGSRPS